MTGRDQPDALTQECATGTHPTPHPPKTKKKNKLRTCLAYCIETAGRLQRLRWKRRREAVVTLRKVKLRHVAPATLMMPIQRQSALRSQSQAMQGEKLTHEESKNLTQDVGRGGGRLIGKAARQRDDFV